MAETPKLMPYALKAGGAMLVKRQKQMLREKLNEAVANEEYEQAAKLRDEIKKLDEGGSLA